MALTGYVRDVWEDVRDLDRALGGVRIDPNLYRPNIDVCEEKNRILVHAEMPGIDRKQINIQVKNAALEISGRKEETNKQQGGTWLREERRYGEFRRVIPLPKNVDEKKICARLNEGVLEIEIPKTHIEEPKERRINIE
eukprot:TRINITY_DN27851_c0_g1_i1.p1 TRINITY_DN27851_c0_g1~~TRINITY_DN27851_c0_g1_i1.p1  ORF type:complete len:148 (+),score=33.93 TRINITY_DN27851_c0_g1_i1:29-445(+)